MIIDHNHPAYIRRWKALGANQFNGAYYYSKEIVDRIIPHVKTDRSWVTVNIPKYNIVPQFESVGCDHAIVFIHNNLHPENYNWLRKYEDLILVCGIPETVEKVHHLGKAIYLPLSIDVEYVNQFRRPKTKAAAFVGRPSKRGGCTFPETIDVIGGMPREELLATMSEYRRVYAVGRTALEAICLDCKVMPYDKRFPDADRWKVIDNLEAARILQEKIDLIDK